MLMIAKEKKFINKNKNKTIFKPNYDRYNPFYGADKDFKMQDLVINFSKDESDFKYKSEFVLDGLWSILEFIEFFILKKG